MGNVYSKGTGNSNCEKICGDSFSVPLVSIQIMVGFY